MLLFNKRQTSLARWAAFAFQVCSIFSLDAKMDPRIPSGKYHVREVFEQINCAHFFFNGFMNTFRKISLWGKFLNHSIVHRRDLKTDSASYVHRWFCTTDKTKPLIKESTPKRHIGIHIHGPFHINHTHNTSYILVLNISPWMFCLLMYD